MTNTISTKAMGIALRQLYPGAFASYQGIIFRVTSPQNDLLSGISPDHLKTEKAEDVLIDFPELADKVFFKIQKEVFNDTGVQIPTPPGRRKLKVLVPGKIDLRMDDKVDKVYCQNPNCGKLWKLDWLLRNNPVSGSKMPKCRCGSRVSQAPIFLPIKNNDAVPNIGAAGVALNVEIKPFPMNQMFCHYKTSNGICRAPDSKDKRCVTDFVGMLGSIVQFDANRPKESLMRCNPKCPKGLNVPPLKIMAPRRQGDFWYQTDFPRESLNAPLTATGVISYDDEDDPEIIEVNEVLESLLGQFFNQEIVDLKETKFSKMKILETVYGYRIGGRISGVSTTYVGLNSKTVVGRVTDTKGFQIVIKPKIYEMVDKIKEQMKNDEEYEADDILEIILHSLKHAMLVQAPLFTGLDENKFHGSYEINDKKDEEWAARVFVYDTEDGGNGGFSTIMRNRDVIENMLDDIRQVRLHCPVRECKTACKHCLFIKNCGLVNRRLNRHLLMRSNIFHLK